MAQGPSNIILVAIRITLRIRESKVRNPDRRRFVPLSTSSLYLLYNLLVMQHHHTSFLISFILLKAVY